MKKILTKDNKEVIVTRTGNVGGPSIRGSAGGGQAFGTHYLYYSKDNKNSWVKADFRSLLQLESYINSVDYKDL